jgi:hypothetical protein
MRTRRSCRQIKLAYQRSFRRPVKIRVETEPPRSADRITPLLPAGTFLRATERPAPFGRPALRIIRIEPVPEPDWRIVGDHELMLREGNEGACL